MYKTGKSLTSAAERYVIAFDNGNYSVLNVDIPPFKRSEHKETCLAGINAIGTGYCKRIILRPGLEVFITDYTFNRAITFNYTGVPSSYEFYFLLSGHFLSDFGHGGEPYEYSGEMQCLNYYNSPRNACMVMPGVPIKAVTVRLFEEFFLAYQKDDSGCLSAVIKNLISDGSSGSVIHLNQLSAQIKELLNQIIYCRLNGFYRTIFLESRALELVWLLLSQAGESSADLAACLNCKMHPQDRKQTRLAQEYLLANLESPPSLADLARAAGMSHPKLNRCFKQLYGMTVFEYLRLERLNKARFMMETQGWSVTETAFFVGYESLSHFSRAYKKQFGISPKDSVRNERIVDF